MSAQLRSTDLALLRALAERGALHRKVKVTSAGLSKATGVSQQAASAALIRLQQRGYIERSMAARGQMVKLSATGISTLRADYALYKRLFEDEGSAELSGTVADGLGEGSYYLSRPGYKAGLGKLLGSEPYKGTLNLKVSDADLDFLASIRGMAGSEVPGFSEGGRTFGPIKCFRAEVGGVGALAVIPARTHYTDVLEIVATVHLRTELGLKEGDRVKVRIHL